MYASNLVNCLVAVSACPDAAWIAIILSTTVAVGHTVFCGYMYYDVFWNDKYEFDGSDDNNYIAIWNGSEIAMKQMQLNALQMLAIFAWKQTILMVKSKDRCALIRYRPFIKWIDTELDQSDQKRKIATDSMYDCSDSGDDYKTIETGKYTLQAHGLELDELNTNNKVDSSISSDSLSCAND